MNDIKQSNHLHRGQDSDSVQKSERPYWKRAHADWRFWVAIFLMIAAMIVYIVTEDFSMWPRNWLQHPHQSSSGNSGTK
jgi:hypothetical protein